MLLSLELLISSPFAYTFGIRKDLNAQLTPFEGQGFIALPTDLVGRLVARPLPRFKRMVLYELHVGLS